MVSTPSTMSTSSTEPDEMVYDVIAALIDDGYQARAAESCVRSTYAPGDNFADAYRKALTAASQLRSSGRLRADLNSISSNGVAGRASVAVVSPAESTATRGASPGAPVTKAARKSDGKITGDRPANQAGKGGSIPTPSLQPQKPEKHVPSEKICGRPGCGKKLTERNQSGFCTQHFYDSKRKSPAGEDAPPVHRRSARTTRKKEAANVETRHAASHIRQTPGLNGNAADRLSPALREENRAEISELELDTLWARMPLAQKVALLFGRKEPA